MSAFNLQVGDCSTIGSLAIEIAKQILILHVQVLDGMTVTFETTHERIAFTIAYALHLPIFQVEVGS